MSPSISGISPNDSGNSRFASMARFGSRSGSLVRSTRCARLDGCVEQVIKRIMQAVNHGNLTEDKAVGLCHEIAAFRRLISVQQGMISQGEAASARLREAPWPNSST